MLSCIFLAGTLFLSDGEKSHNIEQVVTFYQRESGDYLYIEQPAYADDWIEIPTRLRRDTAIEVVQACIAEADAAASAGPGT
jgi:hypothetical protein